MVTTDEAKEIIKTVHKIVQQNRDPERIIIVSTRGI